ncbi:MAG: acyl carrier protein [Lachnospiraceae bacterium]|nr:acyl carrier protein [Lachnospiraceae bacterium]
MTREELFSRITEIFREEFDDDTLVIVDETNAEDIEDWDSLAHVELVMAMEKAFSMKFNLREVGELKNVGEMADLILRKMEAAHE